MEEFDFKLATGDPVVILNAIKSVSDKIHAFHTVKKMSEFTRHCKYLQEKCLDKNIAISTTAMDGMILLCENVADEKPILSMDKVLNDFMSALLHMQNAGPIIQLIFYVMEQREFKYGIMYNQHPLITVVKKDINVWPMILTKIQQAIESDCSSLVHQKLLPFVLYVLYDYEMRVNEIFQQELFQLCMDSFDAGHLNKIILFSKPHLVRTVRYHRLLLRSHPHLLGSLILCIYEIIRNDMEASEGINVLKCFINNLEVMRDFSVELYLLTDCINIAPLVYLRSLLQISVKIVTEFPCQETSLNLLKNTLIKLKLNIARNNRQTSDIMKYIDNILAHDYSTDYSTDYNSLLVTGDCPKKNYLDYRLYVVNEILNGPLRNTTLLDQLEDCPVEFVLQLFDYLLNILYEGTSDDEVLSKAINLLLVCCRKDNSRTAKVLPVLLYRITNATDPSIILRLLHTLPKMATMKENLHIIVTTVKTMSLYSPVLQTVALSIFYELSCVDEQCFCYLQELLVKDNVKNAKEDRLTKAFILKELCRKKNMKLDVYGSELTGYLSRILKGKKDEENSIAQSMAFEGLTHLYRNDHIDIMSVWDSVAPHYVSDTRENVVKRFCEMLGEVAKEPMIGSKQEKFLEEIIKALWNYTMSPNNIIVMAAFRALSQFPVEKITIGLPAHYTNHTGNVFGNVTGTAWIQVLSKCKGIQLRCAADMLNSIIATEIRNYTKHLYDVPEGRGEPANLNYLPAYSIVSALANYLKQKFTTWRDSCREVYLEILRLLSLKYSRPLPPLDWSFLHELIHEAEMKEFCIKLASHQAVLSGSARRLIENYLVVASNRENFDIDVMYIFKCFEFLCNSIQPIIVKPFIHNTLNLVVLMVIAQKPGASEYLQTIIDSLRIVLEDDAISEINKVVIAQEIVCLIENLDHDSEAFNIVLQCSPSLPLKYLYDISCPIQFDELNSQTIERCLKIRCITAFYCSNNPLAYLDTFTDSQLIKLNVDSNTPSNISFSVLVKWLKMLFLNHHDNKNCVKWLMELLVKIQLRLADCQDIQSVMFTCAIFVIAVVVLSGFHVFNEDCHSFIEFSSCFPYALMCLLKMENWSLYISQVSEWLYDISTNKSYKRSPHSDFIVSTFKMSLLTLRNEGAFNEKFKWMKYIEMDV